MLDGTILSAEGAGMATHETAISMAADGYLVVDGTTLEPEGADMNMGGPTTFSASDRELILLGIDNR